MVQAEGESVDSEPSFRLGYEEREHIRVWKDRAEVRVGRFSAEVTPYVRREEIVSFRDELKRLHETLAGTARFEDLDGVVRIEVAAAENGHMRVSGHVHGDNEGWEPVRLEFTLQLDQTFLPRTIQELSDWLASEEKS